MNRLWSVRDLAEYFGVHRTTVDRAIVTRSDFPKPIYPTGEKSGAHRRWVPEEVQAWALRQREAA